MEEREYRNICRIFDKNGGIQMKCGQICGTEYTENEIVKMKWI